MAILYVDGAPETALKNGHVLLTIHSGEDGHTFLITRHAARILQMRVFKALDSLDDADADFEPVPLHRPGRKRTP
jgi:hypothetical protein